MCFFDGSSKKWKYFAGSMKSIESTLLMQQKNRKSKRQFIFCHSLIHFSYSYIWNCKWSDRHLVGAVLYQIFYIYITYNCYDNKFRLNIQVHRWKTEKKSKNSNKKMFILSFVCFWVSFGIFFSLLYLFYFFLFLSDRNSTAVRHNINKISSVCYIHFVLIEI